MHKKSLYNKRGIRIPYYINGGRLKESHLHKIMKNMKPNTILAYTTTIKKYERFHGKKFDVLIDEAIKQEDEKVPEHRLKIYDRIVDFQEWLIDEGYVYNTIKHDITRVKTIYRRCRVRLPYFPPLQAKQCKHNPPVQYHEVLTKEEIVRALYYFKPNFKARIMIMATGGYSLEETDTMTIKQFLDDLYPYHKSHDPNEAMRRIAEKDNIIWCTLMKRVKTSKIYYGMCNPETTQQIAMSWVGRVKDVNAKLFRQRKEWVTKHMGDINDALHMGMSGGFRRFTPHRLRRYNANYLKGNDLTYEEEMLVREIDELQGRALTDVQERYIQVNPVKQKLIYAKYMNNVSLYNQYEYQLFDGDVLVTRIDPQKHIVKLDDENKKLKEKLEKKNKYDRQLVRFVNDIGKDEFQARLSKLLQEL